MLGLGCVGPEFNYRMRILLATMLPVCIVIAATLGFLCQRAQAERVYANAADTSLMNAMATKLFASVDADDSGTIDEHEFRDMLASLHRPIAKDPAASRALMLSIKTSRNSLTHS